MSQSLELTPSRLNALDQIDRYIEEHHSGPTLRKMCELLDIAATSNASYYVRQLMERGLITAERTGARRQLAAHTLRVTGTGKAVLKQYHAQLAARAHIIPARSSR